MTIRLPLTSRAHVDFCRVSSSVC
ncbi:MULTISPECIES: putative leader peptide [Pseudonocardia]